MNNPTIPQPEAALERSDPMRVRTWQDVLDFRGYVVIVLVRPDDPVTIGIPITWVVTSGRFGNLPPNSLIPIQETTFEDFLGQAGLYDGPFWCGEKDRYYRCLAE